MVPTFTGIVIVICCGKQCPQGAAESALKPRAVTPNQAGQPAYEASTLWSHIKDGHIEAQSTWPGSGEGVLWGRGCGAWLLPRLPCLDSQGGGGRSWLHSRGPSRFLACLPSPPMFKRPCKVGASKPGRLGTACTQLPTSLLADRSDRHRLLNSSASTCVRGFSPGGSISSEHLPAAAARGPLGSSGPELRAEVAPGSGTGLRGEEPSCGVLDQGIAPLPPSHVHKITALSMRLNEDLEALFVLSCGPWKRTAAFPGGPALSRSRKSSDGARPHPSRLHRLRAWGLVMMLDPGCQHHEASELSPQANERSETMQISERPKEEAWPLTNCVTEGESFKPSRP